MHHRTKLTIKFDIKIKVKIHLTSYLAIILFLLKYFFLFDLCMSGLQFDWFGFSSLTTNNIFPCLVESNPV